MPTLPALRNATNIFLSTFLPSLFPIFFTFSIHHPTRKPWNLVADAAPPPRDERVSGKYEGLLSGFRTKFDYTNTATTARRAVLDWNELLLMELYSVDVIFPIFARVPSRNYEKEFRFRRRFRIE